MGIEAPREEKRNPIMSYASVPRFLCRHGPRGPSCDGPRGLLTVRSGALFSPPHTMETDDPETVRPIRDPQRLRLTNNHDIRLAAPWNQRGGFRIILK